MMFIGNDANNILTGNNGNDTFIASGGNDNDPWWKWYRYFGL